MCGRYYRRADKQRIAAAFRLGQLPDDFVLPPDFNIAPSTVQPVIRRSRDTGERELVMMRWGLVPYFAKSAADFKGFSTINAKAESVTSKAMWRGPFERRCLVPADGFYEWMKLDAKTKKPYSFAMRDAMAFAFAGLWDAWKDPATGEWLQTFAIVATEPNELTAEVHNPHAGHSARARLRPLARSRRDGTAAGRPAAPLRGRPHAGERLQSLWSATRATTDLKC